MGRHKDEEEALGFGEFWNMEQSWSLYSWLRVSGMEVLDSETWDTNVIIVPRFSHVIASASTAVLLLCLHGAHLAACRTREGNTSWQSRNKTKCELPVHSILPEECLMVFLFWIFFCVCVYGGGQVMILSTFIFCFLSINHPREGSIRLDWLAQDWAAMGMCPVCKCRQPVCLLGDLWKKKHVPSSC